LGVLGVVRADGDVVVMEILGKDILHMRRVRVLIVGGLEVDVGV
jgi:hypothetical protein